MLLKHQEESVPEAVAGIGGQVQAAELALLGLAAAQAAELDLQAMEQVFTFGACAAGGGCGGGRARVQRVQEGARGWARTCSAHCRAAAVTCSVTRVPGVSSFMTQPRTSSHRIFAGAAPRGRFRRPLSARDCFCFARRAAQYPASLTPGISAAAFNAGLQNMRGGNCNKASSGALLRDNRGPRAPFLCCATTGSPWAL